MRDTIIYTELYDLRVYHDKLDILRICLVDDAHDDGIDTDRLTGACSTRDQKMRHLGDIGHHNLTADILADCKGQTGRMLLERIGF